MILVALAKQYWWEAGSPEEDLGWDSMAIIVQLALLALEKSGKMAQLVHKQRQNRTEIKEGKLAFRLIYISTYYDYIVSHTEEWDGN